MIVLFFMILIVFSFFLVPVTETEIFRYNPNILISSISSDSEIIIQESNNRFSSITFFKQLVEKTKINLGVVYPDLNDRYQTFFVYQFVLVFELIMILFMIFYQTSRMNSGLDAFASFY